MKSALSFATFLLVLWAASLPGGSQAGETQDDSILASENSFQALTKISQIVSDYQRHRSLLANASAEDSLVLTLQIDAVIKQFIAEMPQAAALYPTEPSNARDHDLQRQIKELYANVNVSLWELIATKRQAIDRDRAKRIGMATTDRGRLEYHISSLSTQLNELTSYAAEHIAAQQIMDTDLGELTAKYEHLLLNRADETAGRILLSGERIAALQEQLKLQAGDADLTLLLSTTRKILDRNIDNLSQLVDLLDAEEIETSEYRTLLVTVSLDIAAGLLDTQVISTLTRRAWQNLLSWISTNVTTYLLKLLVFLVIVLSGRLLAKLVRKAVQKSLDRASTNISQLLKRTLVSTAYNLVMSLTVVTALTQMGFDLGPLLAGFGVVGFILGFAMQDTLSNFASGLMILFYRPYDVGDLVDISGVFGKVEHMSLVSTSILTLDNQKLIVPNSKIWGDVIKNVTDQNVRRVDMVFGISYSDDIPQVESILEDILSKHDMVLDNPESMVKLHKLNDSSVDFIVRPWVKTKDYWDVYWDVTREVKMRFDAENVSIPFPQQDVHIQTMVQPLPHAATPEGTAPNTPHTKETQVTEAPTADAED